MTKYLSLVLLFGGSAWAADYTCTSTGSGNFNDSTKWNCPGAPAGAYPHNNGSDRYAAVANHTMVQNIASLTIGLSGAPIYGYVSLTQNDAGSGYVGCSVGQISGGTPANSATINAATAFAYVDNGRCIIYLYDRGYYTAGTPSLGAISATNATFDGSATVKGNPTSLFVTNAKSNPYPSWRVGSTQSITISGATGTGWTGLNATWTATVTGVNSSGTTITIPFDSSALSGTPGGTIVAAPGTAASYTLNYIAGGGTAALKVGGASAKVTFASGTATTLLGDMQYTDVFASVADAYVWDASTGSVTVTLDSSLTAGTPVYSLTDDNNFFTYRGITSTGCSAVRVCTLQGTSAAPMRIGAPSDFSPYLHVDTFNFNYVGDQNGAALYAKSAVETVITNSLFSHSGRLTFNARTGASLTVEHNRWTNTPLFGPTYEVKRPINLEWQATNAADPGITRTIKYNAMDGSLGNGDPGASSSLRDTELFGNIIEGGLDISSVYAWDLWESNIIRFRLPSYSAPPVQISLPSGLTSTYLWFDAAVLENFKATQFPTSGTTTSGVVGGFSGAAVGDSGEWFNGNSGSVNQTVQNSVFLCGADGVGAAKLWSPTNWAPTYIANHITFCGGYSDFGVTDIDEGGAAAAGHLQVTNSLMWALTAGSGLKVRHQGAAFSTDACNPATQCDYNGGYNLASTLSGCAGCTNQGRGYGAKWSATPGSHDVDGVNPNFLDRTRRLENFDVKYLGFSLASAWSGGGTYAYGDYVSNSNASVYGGESFNFRCINPSGCTGLGEPGIPATDWRDNWEWGSLSRIAAASYAQTQYTDSAIGCSGCYVAQALTNWVIAGFAPGAIQYQNAASDGTDIGAVPVIVSNAIRNSLFFSIP